jgi:hypothetical protein
VDLGEHQLEGAGHQPMDDLRVELLTQRGEARDIHEQHGDLLPLTFERAFGGEDFLGEVFRGVAFGRGETSFWGRPGYGMGTLRAEFRGGR